jgi:hypothetical protein
MEEDGLEFEVPLVEIAAIDTVLQDEVIALLNVLFDSIFMT